MPRNAFRCLGVDVVSEGTFCSQELCVIAGTNRLVGDQGTHLLP